MIIASGCTTTELWDEDSRFETVHSLSLEKTKKILLVKTYKNIYQFYISDKDRDLVQLFDNSKKHNMKIRSLTWNEQGSSVATTFEIMIPTIKQEQLQESTISETTYSTIYESEMVALKGKRVSQEEISKGKYEEISQNFQISIKEESTAIGTAGKVVATPVTLAIDTVGAVVGFILFLPLMIITGMH